VVGEVTNTEKADLLLRSIRQNGPWSARGAAFEDQFNRQIEGVKLSVART
jgi:hypothetical protein